MYLFPYLPFLVPLISNTNKCISESDSLKNNNTRISSYGFDHPVNHADEDYEDDWEPFPELKRLIEQEAKEIQPHKDMIEIINLGNEKDKKEVKINSSFKENVHKELVKLLFDYSDIFCVVISRHAMVGY